MSGEASGEALPEEIGSGPLLAALLEVLQAAVAGVRRAGDRRAGEVARAWLEHEVAPLVDRLLASGLPSGDRALGETARRVMYLVSCRCSQTGHAHPVCFLADEALASQFVRRQPTRWCRDWIDEDSDDRWRPHTPADEQRTVVPIFRSVHFYVEPIPIAADVSRVLVGVRNYWASEVHQDTPVFVYAAIPDLADDGQTTTRNERTSP